MNLICFSFIIVLAVKISISGKIVEKLKIIGGKTAAKNQFPYMVSIEAFNQNKAKKYYCGGSLISNQWVLTAAHCTYMVTGVTVSLGDIRFLKGISYPIDADEIINHEEFHPPEITNDISLIKIPFTKYSRSIQNIALPFTYASETFVGSTGIFSGWGYTSDEEASHSDLLQYLEVTVMKNDMCKNYYQNLYDNQFCVAIRGGVAICKGDSGGPLVYKTINGNIQIGIASFRKNDQREREFPSGFTRVTSFLSWISLKTGINSNYESSTLLEKYINIIKKYFMSWNVDTSNVKWH